MPPAMLVDFAVYLLPFSAFSSS